MSLPPGFLDELRTRTSLSQVVGRKVMWDNRKSNQAKGDMWAPCPFHQEKSASFHVDDRKGYYYCFGCHAKGDAISFIKETENVEFMEAVEILAQEAGMQMPARDPKAAQKADRRTQLIDLCEAAQKFFALQLQTAGGAAARAYLDKRGLKAEAQQRLGLGFAPDAWRTLLEHLQGKGVAPDLIFAAGLAKPSQKGGQAYDVFRNRIMFPIRDPRGRVIAFGGRAMDPNDSAKYLNSPETDLFDKSRTLYNHGPAREAAGKGQQLLVAEGYMDVIALSEAGFGAAVAPLGTAVTEHQLAMLWRISDEPIIALDGDTAGIRAAYRVIDLALPVLESGKGLRFALMPDGKDPDDVIRSDGAGGVQKVLDGALPMVKLLWQRETEGKVFDSPERKAALDKALREKIKLIRDPSLRAHYGQELKDMRWGLFRQRPIAGRRFDTRKGLSMSGSATKASLLVSAGDEAQDRLREAVIVATVACTPSILPEVLEDLADLTCADDLVEQVREALVRLGHCPTDQISQRLEEIIGPQTLETLLSARHVAITPSVRTPGHDDLARMTVRDELAKLAAQRGLAREIAEAELDLEDLADEAVTFRLGEAAQTRAMAERSAREDKRDYDRGPNGAHIDKDERNALDALLNQIGYGKTGK
ncbi:DNA primase [Pseudoprimorskyibacter insulae]|uniref:DNA primase n=1 Tax=Pseudoprimorskyibacter insulae TaxID=1695997 RepID=A0A2R8AQF4_9RHOB|nr:DNA primase [Pseudoprimorskyibacter insulae]SPF78273.1 DNA primase [Pseudoprimorskyibacter insulae]